MDAFPEQQKMLVNKATELFTNSPLQSKMRASPELFTPSHFPA